MADAKFLRLEQSRQAEQVVWVHYEHVCEAQRGEDGRTQFSWNGIERGGPYRCGCWAEVPLAHWEHGPERMVYEAMQRLGVGV